MQSLMGETNASRLRRETRLQRWLPKTALHRYFKPLHSCMGFLPCSLLPAPLPLPDQKLSKPHGNYKGMSYGQLSVVVLTKNMPVA